MSMGEYGNDFTKEFVKRTLENLKLIDEIHKTKPDKYPPYNITHLINSLLGLVVFVKADNTLNDIKFKEYDICEWNYRDEEKKFLNFLKHLRNAIAHKRIKEITTKDSKNIIGLEFRDKNGHDDSFVVNITTDNIRLLIKKIAENYGQNYDF